MNKHNNKQHYTQIPTSRIITEQSNLILPLQDENHNRSTIIKQPQKNTTSEHLEEIEKQIKYALENKKEMYINNNILYIEDGVVVNINEILKYKDLTTKKNDFDIKTPCIDNICNICNCLAKGGQDSGTCYIVKDTFLWSVGATKVQDCSAFFCCLDGNDNCQFIGCGVASQTINTLKNIASYTESWLPIGYILCMYLNKTKEVFDNRRNYYRVSEIRNILKQILPNNNALSKYRNDEKFITQLTELLHVLRDDIIVYNKDGNKIQNNLSELDNERTISEISNKNILLEKFIKQYPDFNISKLATQINNNQNSGNSRYS